MRHLLIIGSIAVTLIACLIGAGLGWQVAERWNVAATPEESVHVDERETVADDGNAVQQRDERLPVPTSTPEKVGPFTSLEPDTRALLKAEEEWLGTLYRSSSLSVVNITSRSYNYDVFFNVVPQEGTGSGFIWDEQGHIVTNYHVVEGAQELEVMLSDGTQLEATVTGLDPANDLAVIQVKMGSDGRLPGGKTLPPSLPLGDSTALAVGQRVVAIGNPFGLDQTLTSGVISALERVIQSESGDFIGEVIQHDAAINPGNSGGPLLNINGEVVGVNTQIVSPSGANAGIGFAIPTQTLRRVVPELIEKGRYPHPWLGIEGVDLTPGLANRLRRGGLTVPADEGVLVVGTYRGGPTEELLRGATRRVRVGNLILPIGGDLLVALDERPITNQREMLIYLEGHKRVGEKVKVQFWRGDQLQSITVTLQERPRPH